MEHLRKRIASGDSEGFVGLYDELGDQLLRYLTSRLNRTDALDVAQETFARLVRYHRKFAKAPNLTAYVFQVARNEVSRWIKKNLNRHGVALSEIQMERMSAPIEQSLDQAEYARHILDQLSEESREIVFLKIFSGLTFADLAAILALPEATVATKYRRAILKMQELAEPDKEPGRSLANKPVG